MTAPAPDLRHMARALELAARGLATTDPNPRVGCVIARGAMVLAEGWHERAGGPHAEAMALASLGGAAPGATAYATLEPCSHFGRTPPCADALVAAGVRRVVYAVRDPNPRVNGGGAARLAAAGIEVTGGVMEREARALNAGFLSRFERGRPWVRILLPAPRGDDAGGAGVQRLRARSSAVLTGSGTVLADDPRFDVAPPSAGRQPLRVVLDSRLRIPPRARIVAPPGELLVLTASDDAARRAALERAGARVLRVPAGPGGLDLAAVLRCLAGLEVNELQVEAGATLTASLLASGFADERIR
ncbi:MAG TPA: bifunctional diaminohydroxyphosphoribosylaminopyrimidine deaminase/5-amino-6-(5-phosphoribosylamino)uracil reductase RibD [Steroidobacteraceae bacterium]|nr:bifunctional diaminohydroxyphosphoribosylaminopyrimidine deaminase/5-amino-6-(5-phosphoribosylamino)uracil reductase RibD [Steroidobacteraceae bacterium]